MKTATITQSAAAVETPAAPVLRALNPRTLSIDIVLPVLNEAHVIARSVSTLHAYLSQHVPHRWRIIIADNGSTDGTAEAARQLALRYSEVQLIQLAEKGRGRALKQAWLQSSADILAYMDIDLSTNLDSFVPMITPLIMGEAAVATGSRLMKQSRTTRGFKRDTISRCYNWIIRRTMKTKFVDAQCGFKAIRRDAARKILPRIKDTGWFFDTELLVKAEYAGYTIHEEPVEWVEDTDSRVHIIKTATDDLKGLSRVRREYGKTGFGELAAVAGLLLLTSVLYLWNLTINGMANSYYAAAAQAASTDWTAWLFGSLDAANFVSVDKPPISMMIMGLSGRLFGFSSWSMLMPHALAGVATVMLVYAAVKRWYGAKAGLIAGAVMALTPAAALMFRFNNPDSFLTLFLTASAYTFLRAFENKKPVLWLSLAGLFTGLAFNTKMLQGLLVLPVMALLYLVCARPKLVTRLWHLGVAGAVTAVSTFWWSVLVWLTPAAHRPWVGSTNDNNIWSLIFGYNGFGRLLGSGGGPGKAPGGGVAQMGQAAATATQSAVQPADHTATQAASMTPPTGGGMGGHGGGPGGVGFGGETGVLRIFNESFGPNIAWLLVIAVIGGGLVLWLLRRAPRHNKERVGVLLWLGWLLIHVIIFSMTSGTIHPYYVVAMAPSVAALVGIGTPYLWQAYTRRTKLAWLVPLTILLTTIIGVIMLGYSNTWPWLTWLVIITGGAAAVMTLVPLVTLPRWYVRTALVIAVLAGMAAPVAFSLSTIATAHSGSIPTAGPGATAMSGTNNESAQAEAALVSYLVSHQQNATWLAAVNSANESAPIQLSTGKAVMAVGGFNGSDSTLTLEQFKQLVRQGSVRYYVVSQHGPGGHGGQQSTQARTNSSATSTAKSSSAQTQTTHHHGGPGGNSAIATWAASAGTKVDYGGTQYTVYDLSQAV